MNSKNMDKVSHKVSLIVNFSQDGSKPVEALYHSNVLTKMSNQIYKKCITHKGQSTRYELGRKYEKNIDHPNP